MLPPSAVRCLRRLSRHSMLVLRAIMDRVSLPSNHLVGQKWTLSLGRGMRAWRQGAAAAVDEDGVLTAIAGMSVSETPVNDPGRRFAHPLSHPSDGVVAMDALRGLLSGTARRCHNSYPSIPSIIAATKTTIGRLRPARLTSAGPGQRPTRPQPIPNRTAPATSGASMSRRSGQRCFAAKVGAALRRASAKPIEATATAPAITKASVASHAPKKSRKPRTLAGCVMPEMSRPAPKIRPQTKLATTAGIALASKPMADDGDRCDGGDHEDDSRRDRAGRKPRKTADAMAGCAAVAHAGSEADQQAADRNQHEARCHRGPWQRGAGKCRQEWGGNQSGDERDPPASIRGPGLQQSTRNAADAGNAAGQSHESRGGEPDQGAAEQSGECREVVHSRSPYKTLLLSLTLSASRYTSDPISLNLALICAMPFSI